MQNNHCVRSNSKKLELMSDLSSSAFTHIIIFCVKQWNWYAPRYQLAA